MSHEVQEAGGFTTVIASVIMNVWNWVSFDKINAVIVFITSLLGLIFMVYKIIEVRKNTSLINKKIKNLED